MSEQLTVVAHIRAIDGQIEETRSILMGLLEPTRQESGCIEYWLHQDNEDPAEFLYYENWASRAEWDKHNVSPHLVALTDARDSVFELHKLRLMSMISTPESSR